jgi:hypothetical protein
VAFCNAKSRHSRVIYIFAVKKIGIADYVEISVKRYIDYQLVISQKIFNIYIKSAMQKN